MGMLSKGDRRPKVVSGIVDGEFVSKAKQSFRDFADINKIVARYQKTGMIDNLNKRVEPFYGDVSDIGSYQESMEVVLKADTLFMQMSASVRERFDNDPNKMIKFLSDKSNYDEAVKLGMVIPHKPKVDPDVEFVKKVDKVFDKKMEKKDVEKKS